MSPPRDRYFRCSHGIVIRQSRESLFWQACDQHVQVTGRNYSALLPLDKQELNVLMGRTLKH